MVKESLDRLDYLVKTIPVNLLEKTEEEFANKPNVNKWSKKEILGHLIDSATNNHHRFVRAQFESSPLISYNQDDWNRAGHYQKFDSEYLITFWKIYNQHILQLIQCMPVEKLTTLCRVSETETKTLEQIFVDYITHLEHHLEQIVGADYSNNKLF